MLDNELFYFDLEVENKEELLRIVGNDLYKKGFVKDSYVEALLEREKIFPTGLPLTIGVAIPHTSIDHANENRLVFVKPSKPLIFNEMGNNEETVDVKLVIFLVISDQNDHMAALSKIIEIIQEESIVAEIISSVDLLQFKNRIEKYFTMEVGG